MILKTILILLFLGVNAFAAIDIQEVSGGARLDTALGSISNSGVNGGTITNSSNFYFKDKAELVKKLKKDLSGYGGKQDYVLQVSIILRVPKGQEFTCSALYRTFDDIPDTDVFCGKHYGQSYWLIKYYGAKK